MSSFSRTQSKYVKQCYRVRNWAEYEKGLRNRGSLTVWLGLESGQRSIPKWDAKTTGKRRPGRKRKYANHAIETTVTLGMVFHLPSRQNEGFLRSLFDLLNVQNEVPDHTTICRRKASLGKSPLTFGKNRKPVHIIIDSSALSVHVGQLRRPPKNRDYRKIHLAVDEVSGEVLACDLTSKSARDAKRVPALLARIDRPILTAKADAAYDDKAVYDSIENHTEDRSPRVLIPPKRGATLSPKSAESRERNRNIRSRSRQGKRDWQGKSGYNKRSLVETVFYRYKTIIGPAMKARTLRSQRVEARIGCKILNKMAGLGMPEGRMIK